MSNLKIIIFSMFLSAISLFIIYIIKNCIKDIQYKKNVKRTNYIKQLVKDDKIPYKLINISIEPNRVRDTENHVGLFIDDKLYDDKNSLFLKESEKLYVIGKKEEYLIVLVGGFIK